jgi:hypothetical protein
MNHGFLNRCPGRIAGFQLAALSYANWRIPACFLAILVFASSALASPSQEPVPPAISYIVEGVEQGGTLTLFGERLAPDARVWLWQPEPDGRRVRSSEESMGRLKEMAASLPTQSALPAKPPGNAREAAVLGATGNPRVLMVRQAGKEAPSWQDDAVPTVVWVENGAGFSEPYLVNAPQLWFASEHTVLPGERLRLFGINLFGAEHNPGRPLIALRHRDSGAIHWGEPLRLYNQDHPNIRQHEISFRLPADLPLGGYQVWIHNLSGGDHGWSTPVIFQVVSSRGLTAQLGRRDESSHATPVPKAGAESPRMFPVTDLKGDGVTDVSIAIQQALDAAGKEGGGMVVLPAGVHAIARALNVPAGVILQGAGRDATTLTVSQLAPLSAGQKKKSRAPMLRLRTRTGLQDLSVVAGPGVDMNVLVEDSGVAEDVFLRRVKIENRHAFLWDAEATNWENPDFGLYVNVSTRGFRLLDSEIIAPMTFRMEGYGRRHTHAQIAGNRFETYPHHGEDNVFLLTISESIFENNVMAYGRRAFTSQRGMWRNFIAGNQVFDVRGVANGSELFMSEYGPIAWHGRIQPVNGAAAQTSFELPEEIEAKKLEALDSFLREYRHLFAFVSDGTGFGQFRQVLSLEGRVLHVDSPFRIAPTNDTRVILLGATTQNLFINNANQGGRGVYTFFYGSAVNNVIAGNEAGAGGVTSIWASSVAENKEPALLAYNTFANNRLVRNGSLNIAALDWSQGGGGQPLTIGNRLIRNQVWKVGEFGSPNQYYASWHWQGGANAGHGWSEPGPRSAIAIWNGSYNVVENNYVDDAEIGVFAGPGRGTGGSKMPVTGNVFRWNRIDRTETRVKDEGESGYIEPPRYQR